MNDYEAEIGALTLTELLAVRAKLERTIELLQFMMVHTMLDMYRRGEPVPDFSAPPDKRGRRRTISARS